MNSNKEKGMKLLLLAFLVAACASKDPKESTSQAKHKAPEKTISMESKQLASEEESNLVTEISFPKERAAISTEARSELRQLYKKARAKGKIEEIKVITWADQEYPSVNENELSLKQQDLVKRRNDAIEKYLNLMTKGAEVETISMAERPSALNDLFSSEDAQVKKSLETAGIPNTDTNVKVPGKASKSIVIFIMEEG
jgi:outer membrane protein OmpA-like peptidoglycan-associated protein